MKLNDAISNFVNNLQNKTLKDNLLSIHLTLGESIDIEFRFNYNKIIDNYLETIDDEFISKCIHINDNNQYIFITPFFDDFTYDNIAIDKFVADFSREFGIDMSPILTIFNKYRIIPNAIVDYYISDSRLLISNPSELFITIENEDIDLDDTSNISYLLSILQLQKPTQPLVI